MSQEPHFNGPDYVPARDHSRLSNQFNTIMKLMADGGWRTLREIHEATGHPESSISAQLRHARKPRFGSYLVEKQLRGDSAGLYEYRVISNARNTANE
jgi:hypothetical protein